MTWPMQADREREREREREKVHKALALCIYIGQARMKRGQLWKSTDGVWGLLHGLKR